MDYRALALDFHGVFSRDADRFFFAPGRINLLGEYTEYCGGHVIPCAITLGIYGVVSKRDDRLVRLYSKNFPEIGVIEFTLDELDFQPSDSWGNYPKGMLHFFAKNGYQITSGFDLLVYGDLPYGAGLSSSASLLILTAEIIRSLYQIDIEPIELVEAGRSVENDYIGINCWFRDHYVVTMGKSDHALCIDCHTLDYRYVPLQLANYKLIIMHSNNSRDLAELIKQKRIEECEMALAQLQSFVNIMSLAELTGEQYNTIKYFIDSDILRKRAKHIVSENERAMKAVQELKNGNLSEFGQLVKESHQSLRNDFEITGLELDTLVEVAWQLPHVLGARMTGDGLGGCAFALVEKTEIESFIQKVGEIYRKKIGVEATFSIAGISEGVKELNCAEVFL